MSAFCTPETASVARFWVMFSGRNQAWFCYFCSFIWDCDVDFKLTEEQRMMVASARTLAEREFKPLLVEWDQARAFPRKEVAMEASMACLRSCI